MNLSGLCQYTDINLFKKSDIESSVWNNKCSMWKNKVKNKKHAWCCSEGGTETLLDVFVFWQDMAAAQPQEQMTLWQRLCASADLSSPQQPGRGKKHYMLLTRARLWVPGMCYGNVPNPRITFSTGKCVKLPAGAVHVHIQQHYEFQYRFNWSPPSLKLRLYCRRFSRANMSQQPDSESLPLPFLGSSSFWVFFFPPPPASGCRPPVENEGGCFCVPAFCGSTGTAQHWHCTI